ncbi:unnamed protein product [Jaminaea pallidilutea]
MAKFPAHHNFWARASNSTRASILARRSAAASAVHHHHAHRQDRSGHHVQGHGRAVRLGAAATSPSSLSGQDHGRSKYLMTPPTSKAIERSDSRSDTASDTELDAPSAAFVSEEEEINSNFATSSAVTLDDIGQHRRYVTGPTRQRNTSTAVIAHQSQIAKRHGQHRVQLWSLTSNELLRPPLTASLSMSAPSGLASSSSFHLSKRDDSVYTSLDSESLSRAPTSRSNRMAALQVRDSQDIERLTSSFGSLMFSPSRPPSPPKAPVSRNTTYRSYRTGDEARDTGDGGTPITDAASSTFHNYDGPTSAYGPYHNANLLFNGNDTGSHSSRFNSYPKAHTGKHATQLSMGAIAVPFQPLSTSQHISSHLGQVRQYSVQAGSAPATHSPYHDLSTGLPHYEFENGAYGIPKRHPLAPRGGAQRGSGGPSRGMLAAAADFFTGPPKSAPSPHAPSSNHGASSTSPSTSPSSPTPVERVSIDQDSLRSVQVGEDAYFLRHDSIGIADGVGGWATKPGANPAMFSRLLMHFCSVELSRHDSGQLSDSNADPSSSRSSHFDAESAWWDVDPVEVMHRAWERCVRVSRREGIIGSTTALLAMLRGDQLRIANLGDCVLLIVRRGELLFRSQEQQHSFNFPLQLGMMIKRGTEGRSLEMSMYDDVDRAHGVTRADLEAAPHEDIHSVEAEEKLLERRRKMDALALKASEESAKFQREMKQREYEERRRRAQFEGKDMDAFDAEIEASKEFDFDPRSGAGSSAVNGNGNASSSLEDIDEDHEDENEGSHTVYLGFNDAYPWDEPRRDCGRWTLQVQRGDIIIVASDGLVDNLFDDDIVEEVCRFAPAPGSNNWSDRSDADGGHSSTGADASGPYPPRDFSPQLLSEALCSRAKAISQDSKAVISPFQQRATEEGLHYVGGKNDDISVLVAVVGESGEGAGAGGSDSGGGLELRG